jgi:ferric-dicitrate binding protein FerR (iron transport regulator)
VGSQVRAGDRLQTGPDQGIALLLARNESLRLGASTTLVADARDRFTLLAGRVYADSGDFGYRDGGIVIDTAIGSVADIGTQFAVMLGSGELDVAVREGRVDVQAGSQTYVAKAGERLTVGPDEKTAIAGLSPHDDYWNWAAQLAPAFEIENKSLLDFLRWVARESGRELVFPDSESRMAAMRTELHGSIAGIAPLDAIQPIVATTRFVVRVETDKIVVER